MTNALNAARRRVGEYLSTANSARSDERLRLVYLKRAVEEQTEVARLYAEIEDARPPCLMCGRKVSAPCNDAEGYYEGGPWDYACESYARGERQAVAS